MKIIDNNVAEDIWKHLTKDSGSIISTMMEPDVLLI